MKFIDVKMPSGIDKLGEWYQPYLHSGKRSFNQSQTQNYSDFNLINEIGKAEKVAMRIFDNLLKFYEARERELAEELGVPKDKLDDPEFMANFAANLEKDLNSGATNFPRLAKSAKNLNEMNAQTKTATVNGIAEDHKKIFKKGFTKYLGGRPMSSFNKTEQAAIRQREKDALIITYDLFLDLDDWRKKQEIAIEDDILFALAVKITTGQTIKGFDRELKEFEKTYESELMELEQVSRKLPGQVSPLIVGKQNKGKVKVKGKLSAAAANPINLMHEDTIVFKLNQKTNEGLSKTFDFLLGQAVKGNKQVKLKSIVVGDKQRRTKKIETQNVFVDDAVIEIYIEGKDQPIRIGIDDKQYAQNKTGKEYKYGRGGIVKRPAELAPEIIPFDKLQTYVYLTANSYFYNRVIFDRLLGEAGGGTVGELYQVINWIRGIYSLLPASPVDFSKYDSFNNIGQFVKQDTRMFVVMNDKLMTMTSFLRAVRDQALTKEKVRNTVTNLSRNFVRALSPFRKGRFLTGELKRQKKDFLRQQEAPSFWLQTQAESLSYYSQLHQQFIEPRFGNDLLNQWKYQVRTEFIIR